MENAPQLLRHRAPLVALLPRIIGRIQRLGSERFHLRDNGYGLRMGHEAQVVRWGLQLAPMRIDHDQGF